MGSNDPIFVFKQHFSRNDAEAVVSGLIHHRVVWTRLAEDGYLGKLLDLLPAQKENWSAARVCLAAIGVNTDQVLTNIGPITPQALPKNLNQTFNLQVEQIAPVAAGMLELKAGESDWATFLKKNNLDALPIDAIQQGWGTVFTLLFYLAQDKKAFLQEFISADLPGMQDLLAFILCANPTLAENQIEVIKSAAAAADLQHVLQLLKKMDLYESNQITQLIADEYLAKRPIGNGNSGSSKQSANSGESLLKNINLFKNYAILASYSSHKEVAEDFSKRALNSSDQLSQMLAALNNSIKTPSPGISIDESRLASKLSLASSQGVTGKVLQAIQIKENDPDNARKIGKQIYRDISTSRDINSLLIEEGLGMVVSPVQLVNLLSDLDLIIEVSQTADRLMDLQPMNAELLRCTAELNFEHGDYLKSARIYSRLDLVSELTRAEKQKLICSLENIGQWQSALEIWKRINLVSLDDYEKKAICCYQARDSQEFHETVNAARNFYSSEGLFQILEALLELDSGQTESAQNLVEAFLNNRKRDRYSIYYLIEYYQKIGQMGQASNVIRSLSSLEMNLPEIFVKRCDLAVKSGDFEACQQVLAQAAANAQLDDLPSIEKLLNSSFEAGALESAAEILGKTSGKWMLAPQLTALKAQLLNQQGRYLMAAELLQALISRREIQVNWLVQYGLALLESSAVDFPLDVNRDANAKDTQFGKVLLEKFAAFPENLLAQVIRTELDSRSKLANYQALLNDKENHLNPEIWRVHAGLGKYYFEHEHFDLAVVNFKEAAKAQPQKKTLNAMLLKSLGRLSLYDEAMVVFSGMLAKGDLEIADILEINTSLHRSDQWLLNLEKFAGMQPKNGLLQIGLAQLYAQKGDKQKAQECLLASGLMNSNLGKERLICTQIMLKAGLKDEARRNLEGFLSAKDIIQDSEYLSGAFLYLQMGEEHKALNLLNLVEHANAAVLAFKAQLFNQLNQPREALAAVQLALEIAQSPAGNLNAIFPMRGIQLPAGWQRFNGNPQDLVAYSLELRIVNNDFQGAYQQALQELEKYPESFNLKSLALELSHILGESEMIQKLLEVSPDWDKVTEISEISPIWGETALQFGQEVFTANIVSRCLESIPQSMRVRALQARLLARNGNQADAQALIGRLLEERRMEGQRDDILVSFDQLWLAEAALELRHYAEAMEIARHSSAGIGITTTTAKVFLKALARSAFQNWMKNRLEVTANLDVITDDDRACFEEIHGSEDLKIKSDNEIASLVREIVFWMGKDISNAELALARDEEALHPYVLLAATYQTEGRQKADILMDNFRDDPEARLIMGVLELESEPAQTVEQATALLRGGQADPLTYALLAFGKQNLGQSADAYAALNLALSAWPEEYKWQLRAGELSKSLGDVRASLEHFKKASEVNKGEDVQVYLGELSLKTGSQDGIAYLEKKLRGTSQDMDILLQLGELSFKNNKPQKAARYLDKARKIEPENVRAHLLLSKVALAVGNFEKAHELISEADQLKPQDKNIILQKAAVLAKSQGETAALDYLQHMQVNEIQRDADVIIRQAEYIRAANGAEKALEYLLPKSFDSDNGSLLLATAKNYLELGKYDLSEEFAERALQTNSEDAQPLAMLAKIAGQKGDLDKAVDLLVKAIQNDPFEAAFYMDLARIYQNRRDVVKATETLKNGLRAIPQNFDLSSALGMLYYQQGQYQLAHEALQQAASINPRDENVKRLLSTLTNANIIQGNINDDTFIEKA